jgi:hypothetical protein
MSRTIFSNANPVSDGERAAARAGSPVVVEGERIKRRRGAR